MPEIELHFQDDFSGESVQILVNDRQVAERSIKTRYQTGLAHIEKLNVDEGDIVEARIPSIPTFVKVKIVNNTVDYVVVLKEKKLSITPSLDRLRYM